MSFKKIFFGGIGIIFGIIVLGFIGLVGYYAWQLQFGEVDDRFALEQSLGSAFTLDDSKDSGIASLTQVQHWPSIVRDHNPTFGEINAPITIIAFIDFECPFCRRAFPAFEQIRSKYEPVARVVFKHYPLESIHPNSRLAAIAGQCAEEQGKFWEFYKEVFEGVTLSESRLTAYAAAAGLHTGTFANCQTRTDIVNKVDADSFDGANIGVRGTPTYIVNGIKYEGVIKATTWDQIMLEHLQQ